MCLVDNTAMAIFDCFIPTAVSWGFLGFGMAMVIVSLQIGIENT
jgi:hypothetical protein